MSVTFNPFTGNFDYVDTGGTAPTIGLPVIGAENHRILKTDGSGNLDQTTALTDGQLVIGSTGVSPVEASLSGTTAKINITNGPGSITINTPLGDLINPQEFYVDSQGGNDTTGTGSIIMPFGTLEKALTFTTDTSKTYVIFLSPGDYGVAPLTIPANVSIYGKGANISQIITIDFIAGIICTPVYEGVGATIEMDMSPSTVAIANFLDGAYSITRTDSTGGAHYFSVHNSNINGLDLIGTCIISNCNFVASATVQNSGQAILNNTIVGININIIGTAFISLVGCTFVGSITGTIDLGNTPTVAIDATSINYGGVITVANVTNLDSATYISYTPTTPADWSITPGNVQQALDLLANDKIDVTEKGSNNGVATLDAGGKVPAAQLPNTVMEFQGTWDASSNTPTLADGSGNIGDVYVTTVAGTQDLGSGSITFAVSDWIIYNASGIWEKSINSNAVVSVNGQQGVVTINAINELTGDITAGPASGSESKIATITAGAVTPTKLGTVTDGLTLDQSGTGGTLQVKPLGIDNSHISATAAIARSKLAAGTADHVVINDGSGNFSSEAQLSASRGGTGLDASAASNGQLFIGNGSGVSLATLSAGTGIGITNAAGSITIAATPTSPGDLNETSFAGANNQATPADVIGFAFANASVRSFKAQVSANIQAASNLYEVFNIEGIQKDASWDIAISSVGDDSLVVFSITNAGQLQYMSGSYASFTDLTIKFRALTTSV